MRPLPRPDLPATDPLCPHLHPAPGLYRDDAGLCLNAWSGSTRPLFGGLLNAGSLIGVVWGLWQAGLRRYSSATVRPNQSCCRVVVESPGLDDMTTRLRDSTTTRRFSPPVDMSFDFASVGSWSKNYY